MFHDYLLLNIICTACILYIKNNKIQKQYKTEVNSYYNEKLYKAKEKRSMQSKRLKRPEECR